MQTTFSSTKHSSSISINFIVPQVWGLFVDYGTGRNTPRGHSEALSSERFLTFQRDLRNAIILPVSAIIVMMMDIEINTQTMYKALRSAPIAYIHLLSHTQPTQNSHTAPANSDAIQAIIDCLNFNFLAYTKPTIQAITTIMLQYTNVFKILSGIVIELKRS